MIIYTTILNCDIMVLDLEKISQALIFGIDMSSRRDKCNLRFRKIYQEGILQFKVPQNIDLEDKIVGPLTLIQFLYLLAGGIVDYLILISIGMGPIFWLIGIPIACFALAMAFLKIQDQPLSHFIVAGLYYLQHPKTRVWQRQGEIAPILIAPKKEKKTIEEAPHKEVDMSQLEQLAYTLDTQKPTIEQRRNLGSVTAEFEKLLKKENK